MIITQEMARTMLMDSKLTDIFWTHAVHTIVHIQSKVILKNNNDKTPYELWKGSADNNLYIKAVGQVARFQAAPKESHVLAVKRIFRYLKGT
jgi:hypothetical protein